LSYPVLRAARRFMQNLQQTIATGQAFTRGEGTVFCYVLSRLLQPARLRL